MVVFGWGAVVSLSSLRAPLSPLQLFFCFDSFKSNYSVWMSSFWMVKNSDVACSYSSVLNRVLHSVLIEYILFEE